jgi:6-phosphogluconolactonase (cycloisomerase 2 family)
MNIHRFAFVLMLTPTACAAPQGSTEEEAATTEALAVDDGPEGHVYALSNEHGGNAVLVFDRGPNGALDLSGRVSTGGLGSDDGLGSEYSIVLSRDRAWLLASNAGSNELSLFRLEHGVPRLSSVVPSGGDRPVSVTEQQGIVYVLNAGAQQNITGFRIAHGSLIPIASSTRPLSHDSPVGAAEVAFSPDGSTLVVTEKGTNSLDGFPLQSDGTPGAPSITPSVGSTPFGFSFDRHGTLVVSDAFGGAPGAGAVSSYTLDSSGGAHVVTGALATGQGAPCWVVTTNDSRFAYIANTASGTITGLSLDNGGSLSAFDGGATASTGAGSKPADLALTRGSRFLYVRNGNGTLAGFAVGPTGALSPVSSVSGLPAHTAGIAAE